MARATLVCCVLSVFVICLLLFFVVFCCFFFFFFFFFLGGGGLFCFVVFLFGFFFVCFFFFFFFFFVSAIDALDLVRNTRNSEQTEYVHIRERGAANRVCWDVTFVPFYPIPKHREEVHLSHILKKIHPLQTKFKRK